MNTRKKRITEERLDEVLSTVNTNVINNITVEPYMTCSSGLITGFYINVGYNTYDIWVADIDDYYTTVGISMVHDILTKYKNTLPITVIETNYYHNCNKLTFNI